MKNQHAKPSSVLTDTLLKGIVAATITASPLVLMSKDSKNITTDFVVLSLLKFYKAMSPYP